MAIVDGKFRDERWVDGRWDLSKFAGKDGETDWDMVRPPTGAPSGTAGAQRVMACTQGLTSILLHRIAAGHRR